MHCAAGDAMWVFIWLYDEKYVQNTQECNIYDHFASKIKTDHGTDEKLLTRGETCPTRATAYKCKHWEQ